ncbi:MAG: short-chain dehydrogenase/reductase [Alphaproteobacteria bacterium]|nr:short-chain dehydrogenase/reductase [Alphaproteobacteria bacterium]
MGLWLEGQAALVTGGATGIGAAVVDRFLEEGASVGVLAANDAQVDAIKQKYDGRVVAVAGDVRSLEDNERAVAAVVEAFGKLDTFVGNAGIWDYLVPLMEQPADRLSEICDEIYGVNVKGYMLGARAAVPELRKTKGSIVFTASTSSFLTGGGGPIYVASKHAVVGLIKQLAWELTPDVRVNGVAPGGTRTPLQGSRSAGMDQVHMADMPGLDELVAGMTPMGRIAEPEDHAGHYVLLASPRNGGYATGTIILSDGGAAVGKRPEPAA